MMKTTLHFLRHGALEGERTSVLHGPNDPVTLSTLGTAQIAEAASILLHLGTGVIFSSGESRTKESAELLRETVQVPIHLNDELRGREWGAWAGKEWEEVHATLADKSLEERYLFRPPGGESWKEFEERVLAALDVIVPQHAGQAICIVSHGSVIRVLLPKVFGMSIEDSLTQYPAYASIWSVEYDGENYSRSKLG